VITPALIGTLLTFLADHADVIEAIIKAIDSGASKESVKAAIKAAQIEASDAVMREELEG
jgi:hypothetical protein